MQGVARNIEELKGQEKIENRQAAENVRALLGDIKVAQAMLEVLRRCRVDGTTVKEFWAAMDRNDVIVAKLLELEGGTDKNGVAVKGTLQKTQELLDTAKGVVDAKILERDKQESTWGHKAWSLLRTDTTYSDRVTAAEAKKVEMEAAVQGVRDKIEALKKERKEEFEREPLIILRSLDEAADNLTERMIGIGQNGIGTIQVSSNAMLKLLKRANTSEQNATDVAARIAAREILLKNFRAGAGIASTNTNKFEGELEEQRQVAETDLVAARAPAEGEPDEMQVAKLDGTVSRLRGQSTDVMDYKGRLNELIASVNGAVSDNTRRAHEAETQKGNVRASKVSIGSFTRGTLNAIGNSLEGVMQSMRTAQTDETRHTFDALGAEAVSIGHGLSEHMLARKQEMAAERAALYTAATERLRGTVELITQAVEISVQTGATLAEKEGALAAATQDLDLATMTQRAVDATISGDRTRQALRPGTAEQPPVAEKPPAPT